MALNFRMFRKWAPVFSNRVRSLHQNHAHFPDFIHYLKRIETSSQRDEIKLFHLLKANILALQSSLKEIETLKSLAEEEQAFEEEVKKDLSELEPRVNELVQALGNDILLAHQRYDRDDAILEVLPGAGGLEASVFAAEIFNLYCCYCRDYLGYDLELKEHDAVTGASDHLAISKASVLIKGVDVFKKLKYECGVHRVQRVPLAGSKNDRLQTSTCSVSVVPVLTDFSQVEVNANELSVTYCRSSGPGGQGVNTTNSAVRMVHNPTKTVVNCQDLRTAHENYGRALEKLKREIYRVRFEKESSNVSSSRKSQIGRMNRNEKIRTYHYGRHTLLDHRIGGSAKQVPNLFNFMRGEYGFSILDLFYSHLKSTDEEEQLLNIIKNN